MSQTGAKTRHSDADEASNVIEERLRLIIDTIPTMVWRKLPDGTADFLNQQFREYTGLSLEDGLGWLHPPMLDEAGLEDAFRHYVKGFAERTGIEVELEISPRLGRMKPGVELALFRVVQESLTNIQRHSGSFQAKIRIERDPRKITLEISDKGSGIPGNLRRQNGELSLDLGVGIPSMHERVKLIGGQLDIESSSGGTTARVTIPADD
jgi:signal transduction histidine kinase